MPKLTIKDIPPAPVPPETRYILELDRDEAQLVLNIFGGMGGKQYNAIRANSLRPDNAWPWDGYSGLLVVNPASTIVSGIARTLGGARGLVDIDGKVNA